MKKSYTLLLIGIMISLSYITTAKALNVHASRQFSSTPVFGAEMVASTPLEEGTLFASSDGSGNSCSEASPCAAQTAFLKLTEGDVLFLRGGEYLLTANLEVNASGTAENPIIIESYPGELAIFNGNETVASLKDNPFSGYSGIRIRKNYIFLRKLEIKQMGLAGVKISGSYNKVEGCELHHNFLSGINIYGGEWHCNPDCPPYEEGYNLLQNNIIHDNSDAGLTSDDGYYNEGDNSDGIAISSGKENRVIHNTVYGNSDDGIDVWRSNDAFLSFNRVYDNGRGAKGNGNGIKAGGNLDPNATNGMRAVLRNNISYDNLRRGIDYNAGKDVTFLYNTSYHNGTSGFTSADDTLVEHNLAANNGQSTITKVKHAYNSWQIAGTVEFVSIDPVSSDFLRPLPGSAFEEMGAYNVSLVSSIIRADANPTNTSSVDFAVTFSEAVTGVDITDFTLTTTAGISGASPLSLTGSGATYTVTVDTGFGNGDIRLDVVDDGTIQDTSGNPLGSGFTSGETYTVIKIMIPMGDFDGDGKAEKAIFRPSNSTWYVYGTGSFLYGQAGDIPVPADYNGDGKDDVAVFRPSNSTWYIYGVGSSLYGQAGDIPVPADYDGDGKDDIAIFRPSNSTWYVYGVGSFQYGEAGDIPVVADYNGDGKANIAVFRPTNSTWYVYGVGPFVYGEVGDIPVIADYNGDGKANIAVFRPSNSTWYVYGIGPSVYGAQGDIPVVADYDGNGKADIAVFRTSNSTWYIQGVGSFLYGTDGDIPVSPSIFR